MLAASANCWPKCY